MGTVVGNSLRLAYSNNASLATTAVSPTNEVTSLPAENVQNQQISKVWRSTTLSPNLDFLFSEARAVQQAAIRKHNLTSSASLNLLGATNSSFSPVAATLSLSVTDDLIVGEFDSEQSYKYWRLQFNDGTNTDGYIEIGHVFLGPYTEFDFPDNSMALSTVDPSVISQSYDGNIVSFGKTKYRVVEFGLSVVEQQDRRELTTIVNDLGIGQGSYLFLDPESRKDDNGVQRLTIFGRFTGVFKVNHQALDWWGVDTLRFEELR